MTRRVPLVRQECLTLPELTPVVSGCDFAQFLVICVVFYRSLFDLSVLVIVLSALLQFTNDDYPFGTINNQIKGRMNVTN